MVSGGGSLAQGFLYSSVNIACYGRAIFPSSVEFIDI